MKRLVVICVTAVLILTGSDAFSTPAEVVLTFDDLPPVGSDYGSVPDGYGGLDWYKMYYADSVKHSESQLMNGMVSPPHVAYGGASDSALVSSESSIDFIGAYLTSVESRQYPGFDLNIVVDGFRGGTLVYHRTVVVNDSGPTWFEFNFINVNHVIFYAYFDLYPFPAPYPYTEPGTFVMDNFTFIPEPATILLLTQILEGYGDSRLNIHSGSIVHYLYCNNNSQINVSGGSASILVSFNSSQINVSGGSIGDIYSGCSSQVNVSGGSIGEVGSGHFGRVNISGGSIGDIYSEDSGQINISGGSIEYLSSFDSSCINISGGLIGYGYLPVVGVTLFDESIIQIFGYDFEVDGQPFGFGELTSILGDDPYNEPFRHLTGTLLSSEALACYFLIGHDAKIILIPEPVTILLLGLGGLILRKKRKV